ncbi:hypothetical protein H0H93_014796, partial [Arthromyces matolae]
MTRKPLSFHLSQPPSNLDSHTGNSNGSVSLTTSEWHLTKPSLVSYLPLLSLPPLLTNPLSKGHPHLQSWHDIGHAYHQRWHEYLYGDSARSGREEEGYPRPRPGSCRVQVVRSVSDWSHGVLTERSIQNACELLFFTLISPSEPMLMMWFARHQVDWGGEAFHLYRISTTHDGDQVKNRLAQALVERITRAYKEGTKFK